MQERVPLGAKKLHDVVEAGWSIWLGIRNSYPFKIQGIQTYPSRWQLAERNVIIMHEHEPLKMA